MIIPEHLFRISFLAAAPIIRFGLKTTEER